MVASNIKTFPNKCCLSTEKIVLTCAEQFATIELYVTFLY